ncbi:unnamed protein product [Ranitomeya imitator]|uniref:Reverse transcriptase domain-containing protein n=1 Tax=Ranitomeya imitator TaxID=111125 RepID=A0ABN9M4T5_9NEOB|nr:unnamed protein product [Ranitomeya imitator]
MVVDDEEKANILNTFFSTVFTVENEMLGEIPRNNENPILRVTNLTQEEVRNRLNKIKIDKSPGPDGIHPRVLRELSNGLYSDRVCAYPQDWRIANVVPIFKKGSKSEPGNYRPVSLTSIVGKIFEGFLRDVILDYLNENNCLTPYQHGFMRNRSCQTNLISFYKEVSYRLDHGGYKRSGDITSYYSTGGYKRSGDITSYYSTGGYKRSGDITSYYSTGGYKRSGDITSYYSTGGYKRSGDITSYYSTGRYKRSGDITSYYSTGGYKRSGDITSYYSTGGYKRSGDITSYYSTGDIRGAVISHLITVQGDIRGAVISHLITVQGI